MNTELYKDFDSKKLNSKVVDRAAIEQAIETIIMTKKGSMPGKPEFGCGLPYYIFELLDHITSDAIQSEISRSLTLYEPRIKLKSVDVTEQPEFNRLIVSVNYYYSAVKTTEFQTFTLVVKTNV